VIDDEKITGYRYLIQEIQDQYLVCILKCRKGKIIDIIRFHQPKEDEDKDSIQNKLSREFDEISWTYHDTNYRM
jgi:hypothetical protein